MILKEIKELFLTNHETLNLKLDHLFGSDHPSPDRSPSEEFDLTKMSWGDHDILTAVSHDYFTAMSF